MHKCTFAEDDQMLSVLNQGRIRACKAFAGSLRGFATPQPVTSNVQP